MAEIVLYEFKCTDEDCGKIVLAERFKAESCPYCCGDIDYTPGRIEPVLSYTPRSERK